MAVDLIIGTPVDTIYKTNIRRFIEAFGKQMEDLHAAIDSLFITRQIDNCTGKQLDQIGTIVNLSRHEAGVMISDVKLAEDDDVYRMLLKYKAMLNTPATFYVTITASFSDAVLSLLQSHSIVIRPSGVTARISCSDTQFFGFADCDDAALGFGMGEFAQSIT